MEIERAKFLVGEYGQILASKGENILDEKVLPASKEEMKIAIKILLKNSEFSNETKEALKVGFINLADFQENLSKDFLNKQTELNNIFSKKVGKEEISELRNKILKNMDSKYLDLLEKAKLEGELLYKELGNLEQE